MAEPTKDEQRAFLIAAIQHEHDLFSAALQHERELREAAIRAEAIALRKQAAEYERRLDELNHAHAQSNEDKQAFMLKVTYEAFVKEYDLFKLAIVERFATEAARQAASAKLWAILSSALTAIITALVIWFLTRGST